MWFCQKTSNSVCRVGKMSEVSRLSLLLFKLKRQILVTMVSGLAPVQTHESGFLIRFASWYLGIDPAIICAQVSGGVALTNAQQPSHSSPTTHLSYSHLNMPWRHQLESESWVQPLQISSVLKFLLSNWPSSVSVMFSALSLGRIS